MNIQLYNIHVSLMVIDIRISVFMGKSSVIKAMILDQIYDFYSPIDVDSMCI